MNKQDYHHDYNLEITKQEQEKYWSMRDVKDKDIRRKVAERSKQYFNNLGKHPNAELKKKWVEKLENKQNIF